MEPPLGALATQHSTALEEAVWAILGAAGWLARWWRGEHDKPAADRA